MGYIICDVRAVSFVKKNFTHIPEGLIFIDGEDTPFKIKPSAIVICRRETDGSDFSRPLPMSIPQEIYEWIKSYDNEPKSHSIGFLGGMTHETRKFIVDSIGKLYPDALSQ